MPTSKANNRAPRRSWWVAAAVLLSILAAPLAPSWAQTSAPTPLTSAGHPVDWWFAFKLNAGVFPTDPGDPNRACPFGGDPQAYRLGQAYILASAASPNLAAGPGLIGAGDTDPLGATFGQIYKGRLHYLVWNDQFYDHPAIHGDGTWAHSKGMVAWDDDGEGLVLQVTTPSWPAAGSQDHPRVGDGNTLGCIQHPDNIIFSQHFFALKLSHADLVAVLHALANASVITETRADHAVPALFDNGGPGDVQVAAAQVGVARSASVTPTLVTLSSGVRLISKPSALHAPPWQLVSALLGQTPLRAATWWGNPNAIASTDANTPVGCWSADLPRPGPVAIAQSGTWDHRRISLKEGPSPDGNHAKIGVSTDATHPYVIFGDMNQQGALNGTKAQCAASQNPRGGLFFVLEDRTLWTDVSALIGGDTAPLAGAPRTTAQRLKSRRHRSTTR